MEYHIESYHQTPSNVSVFPDYRMSPLSPGCQDQPTLSLILFTIIKFLLSEGVLDDELKGKKRENTSQIVLIIHLYANNKKPTVFSDGPFLKLSEKQCTW